MSEIIKITNLNYLDIFHNFNISLPSQKFISISGPNNCGKTTLIRILSGELFQNKSIIFNGTLVEEQKLDKYLKMISSLIPEEITFIYNTLEEELLSLSNKSNKDDVTYLLKELKLSSIKNIPFISLDLSTLIKIKLLLILLNCPKVLLLDDIGLYFSKEDYQNIITILKKYQEQKKLTIIMTTSNLEETITTDYLYILLKGAIYLEGKPIEVLKKDNVLNKIGLRLPFMIDLSVKLKDYNLITEIELDMDRMVDKLWK